MIEFTVSNEMTSEFRKSVMEVGQEEWRPLCRLEGGHEVATGQEWAELVYVPNAIAFTKHARTYRVKGIVTNRDGSGEELIRWHYERCGKSEIGTQIPAGSLPLSTQLICVSYRGDIISDQ